MMIFAAFFLLVVLLLYLYRHRIIAYVLLIMEDLGFYQEGPPDPVANPLPKEHVVMKNSKNEDWLDGIFFAGALIAFGLESLIKKATSYLRLRR